MKCNVYILADQLRRRGYHVSTIIHNPDLSCNMFEEIKPGPIDKESCSVAIYMDSYFGRSLYGHQDKELPLTILCFCSQSNSGDDLDDNWNWIFASSAKEQRKIKADLESIQRELSQWQDEIAQSVVSPTEFKQFAVRIAKYQHNPVIVTDPAYSLVSCGGIIPASDYIDDPILAALFERKNEGFYLMEEQLSQSLKTRFEAGNGNSTECDHKMFAISDSGGHEYGQVIIPALNVPFDEVETSYLLVAMETIQSPGVLGNLKKCYRSHLKDILSEGMRTSSIQVNLMKSIEYCFGWKQGELYRLILVASRGTSIDATVVRLATIGIKETLPSCDVFTVKQGKMVILDRISESDRSPADAAAIEAGLMKLCRDHNLRMASSMVYNDYTHLHLAYLQAAQAIDAPANGQPIVYFHEMSPYLMVRKLGQTGRPEWFCHSAVLRLNDDADPERRLLGTLFAYLMRGSNESATAEALGVTRVTVSKRIAKLKVLLDLDLGALSDHERLHLALSCSIIKNNSKNNQEEDYGRHYDE